MVKNIIVTGSSRGIGLELVKTLASRGHKVLALSRNSKPVNALGLDGVVAFEFDLCEDGDLKTLDNFIKEQWTSVDVLINNAGALINKPFAQLSRSDFKKVFDVNIIGLASVTQLVIPYMPKHGHVVSISSMGGVQGSMKFPGLAAYSSSKGAVITLTELLAEEYKESGPSFNVLALGAVQTEMLAEAFPGYQVDTSAVDMAKYIAEFSLTAHQLYNGKLLQVSNSTP
ncbi:SDR family NAD(P)-dependent oxidoreductase [Galbibacter sp.]|uniref:SDR family NAD(P)-dependent oxidoreductase n=1 Tax=Galbibacter sp. TaxID=2918471 RepID=UPI003A930BD1